MMPAAMPFTPAAAARWSRTAVPVWVHRWVLPAAWVAALAAAVIGDTRPCSPQDPAVCGPDQGFALLMTVLVATPVLLWWIPTAGLVAGLGSAAAVVLADDVASARVAFGCFGIACLGVALWSARCAVEQRRIAAGVSSGLTGSPELPGHPQTRTWNLLPLAGAAVLVVGSLAPLWYYRHQAAAEQAHLPQAISASAEVVAENLENSTITLMIDPGSGVPGDRRTVAVLDTGTYPQGSRVPVLLDPADDEWARLVAEPQDVTHWLSLAYGAWLLAVLLAGREVVARRRRVALATGAHPAWRVRVQPDDDGRALLLPVAQAGGRWARSDRPNLPFARMAVVEVDAVPPSLASSVPAAEALDPDDESGEAHEWNAEVQASFGRVWRGEPEGHEPFSIDAPEPQDAVVVGDLRYGGWAAVITSDAVLLPGEPLRSLHWTMPRFSLPWRTEAADEPAEQGALPGEPVTAMPLDGEPALPLAVSGPPGRRALGIALAVAAMVGAPAAELWLADSWYLRGLVVVLGAQVLVAGAYRALSGVELSSQGIEVRAPWRNHSVPWALLHGVRRDGPLLFLAWEPDVLIGVGPFTPGDCRDPQERAKRLGGLMVVLQERAMRTADTGRWYRTPGPAWTLVAVLVLECALAVWWSLR